MQTASQKRDASWWLRNNIAPAVRMQMGDEYADELLKYADRLSDCDRRVKELEGALREYADEKNWMCSNTSDGHKHNDGKCCLDEWNHATIWYPQDIARTALATEAKP